MRKGSDGLESLNFLFRFIVALKLKSPQTKKASPFGGSPCDSVSLFRYYFISLLPFSALYDLEGHFLTGGEGFESLALNRGKMNEYVFPALLLQKTITLTRV